MCSGSTWLHFGRIPSGLGKKRGQTGDFQARRARTLLPQYPPTGQRIRWAVWLVCDTWTQTWQETPPTSCVLLSVDPVVYRCCRGDPRWLRRSPVFCRSSRRNASLLWMLKGPGQPSLPLCLCVIDIYSPVSPPAAICADSGLGFVFNPLIYRIDHD